MPITKEKTKPIYEMPKEPVIVKVILKGFMVTEINQDKPKARIGALPLKTSKCHWPKVQVYKITPDGEKLEFRLPDIDLTKDFTLNVTNPFRPGIRKYQYDDHNFMRLDEVDCDRKDFRWFVDLDEMHGTTVKVEWDRLNPIFTLDNGLFHTIGRSDTEVRIKKKGEKRAKRFGKCGTDITARTYFKPKGSKAIFKNGSKELFSVDSTEANNGVRYLIVYDCNCYVGEDTSDFPHVYDVISDYGDQFELVHEDYPVVIRRNPEVYCTGGNTSGK